MGRDRDAAPRARCRPSRLLPRRDAGMPATLQLHAGDRRARRSADGAGAAAARCRARARTPAIAAGILDAGRRASLPPDGEAAATTSGRMRRPRSTRSPPPTFERPTKQRHQPTGMRDQKQRALEPSTRADVPESIDAVVDLLAEAGLVPERPRALLEGTTPQPSRLTRMRPLMAYLRDTDHTAYLERSRELAFLANTLMAGCSVQSRAFTAQEASDAAAGICNLGLEHWPARWPDAETHDAASTADAGPTLPDTFLADHDLVMAFEVGWAVLHEDVSMFVAEQPHRDTDGSPVCRCRDPKRTARPAARAREAA